MLNYVAKPAHQKLYQILTTADLYLHKIIFLRNLWYHVVEVIVMSKHSQDIIQEDIGLKADEITSLLPEFAHKFFDHMKTIDRSPRTRLQYAYDLKRFFDYLQNQPGFKEVNLKTSPAAVLDVLSYDDIQEYLNTLNESTYTDIFGKSRKKINSSSFKARNISVLRSFYKFYYKHGEIEKDMANLMEMPKIRNTEKFVLDSSQVNRMLDAVENHARKGSAKNRLRDKAILTLLFGTGIRVSELVGIDISDVDFINASIVVTRKGGDQDIVYFGPEVEESIQKYLQYERPEYTTQGSEDALFLSNRKQRLSVRMVQELVGTYATEAGLSNMNVTPHSARRSFGTHLYNMTGDLYLVADTLHHQSIQTTRRYAKMSEDNKRKAQKYSSDLFKN